MVFVAVAAGVAAPDDITEEDTAHQLLHWCGFNGYVQSTRIFTDSLGSFDYLKVVTPKDITAMSCDFASRPAASRIFFGVRCSKKLMSMLHFIQDSSRVSETPTIVGLTSITFNSAIETALARADIRETLIDQTSTSAKAASPGPLINKRKWKEWETKFENYLSTIIGSNGVPLSYVIRENDNPPTGPNRVDQLHQSHYCVCSSQWDTL